MSAADSPTPGPDITRLLHRAGAGESGAADDLLAAIYGQLRCLAQARLAGESTPTLQATELVHEAWLRLHPGRETGPLWDNRRHFFAAAAESMRRILVEHARARGTHKRGGRAERVPLGDVLDLAQAPDASIVFELDEALTRLAAKSPDVAEIVQLRFFAGLSVEETAELTGLSRSTVLRKWQLARAWLFRELFGGEAAA